MKCDSSQRSIILVKYTDVACKSNQIIFGGRNMDKTLPIKLRGGTSSGIINAIFSFPWFGSG